MNTRILSLALAASFLCATVPFNANASTPAKGTHHVMWTNDKGEAKCKNAGTKQKAEKCAAKMTKKGVANVQVMAGKCSSM